MHCCLTIRAKLTILKLPYYENKAPIWFPRGLCQVLRGQDGLLRCDREIQEQCRTPKTGITFVGSEDEFEKLSKLADKQSLPGEVLLIAPSSSAVGALSGK